MSSALLAAFAAAVGLSAQQSLVEGLAESRVRILIYEDLQCTDSAVFRQMMDEKLLPRYSGSVAFVHREFPLARHAWARKAAIAARYFADIKPELGLAYRKHILAAIEQTTVDNFNERLSQFARENGADPKPALAALDNGQLGALVERDFQDGVARGVSKTPTVFVNGKAFVESFSVEELSQAIDDALAGN